MALWIIIAALGIVIDQVTKYLALEYLKPIDTVSVIDGLFSLTYVENTGAAFGMLKDHRWVFMILSTVAIIGLIIYLIISKPKSVCVRTSLGFIISGGIGNMIDRVGRGFVVDLFEFDFINFYVFNFADALICVGSALLIIYIIFSEFSQSKKNESALNAQNQQ